MVETIYSERRLVGTKIFILFLNKMAPLSLEDVIISFMTMLMFTLLQVLGHSHLFNKVIELDIG